MPKQGTKTRTPTEDEILAAILRVKPTADIPTHPKGKGRAKAKPKKKSGK